MDTRSARRTPGAPGADDRPVTTPPQTKPVGRRPAERTSLLVFTLATLRHARHRGPGAGAPSSSERLPPRVSYCPHVSNEQRSTIFGSGAGHYDRYRPSYPRAVIDMVVEHGPAVAVDAACGTGKAATLVAQRGVYVIGVEPDDRTAEIARDHGVAVTCRRSKSGTRCRVT